MTQPSKLLDNLDQQLKACTDRAERSRLVCRKAIHLARLDRLDDARAELAGLRSALANTLDPVSATWIMLAEGVAYLFSGDVRAAQDRMKRASGIAHSAELEIDTAAANAWLAHLLLVTGRNSDAVAILKECLRQARSDDHFSLTRAAIVAAEMYGIADEFAKQRTWEGFARHHAAKAGDEVSIAALLMNSALDRINLAAIANAFGEDPDPQLNFVRMELKSSLAFDRSFSDISLQQQPGVLWGQVCLIDGKFEEAVKWLMPASSENYYLADRTTANADLAYVHLKLGQREEASRFALRAEELLLNSEQTDDTIALASARLAAYYRETGSIERSAALMETAQVARRRFRQSQDQLSRLLADLPNPMTE